MLSIMTTMLPLGSLLGWYSRLVQYAGGAGARNER